MIDTVVSKYADHSRLYRQSAILERETGIELSRATLDGWVMRVGELLRPISAAMGQELLSGSYIQADETTVGVQMHDGRGKNHQAYLWQYSHPAGPVVFDFRLGREREGPKRFLGNFEGLLQSDGYGAYDHIGGPKLVHAACWAHYLESVFIWNEGRGSRLGPLGVGCGGLQIKRCCSKGLEKRQQASLWLPRLGSCGFDLGMLPKSIQRISLHLQIGGNVPSGGGHTRMAEIVANDGDVGA